MPFKSEAVFENAFITELQQHGWGEHAVIQRPTEAQLLQNWAEIFLVPFLVPTLPRGNADGRLSAVGVPTQEHGNKVSLK